MGYSVPETADTARFTMRRVAGMRRERLLRRRLLVPNIPPEPRDALLYARFR